MGFDSMETVSRAVTTIGSLPDSNQTAWIGAASVTDSLTPTYFLDGSPFTFRYQQAETCNDCRCLSFSAGEFHSKNCDTPLPYLCGCQLGGDQDFHSLDSLDDLLNGQIGGYPVGQLVIGICAGVICLAIGIFLRFRLISATISEVNFCCGCCCYGQCDCCQCFDTRTDAATTALPRVVIATLDVKASEASSVAAHGFEF